MLLVETVWSTMNRWTIDFFKEVLSRITKKILRKMTAEQMVTKSFVSELQPAQLTKFCPSMRFSRNFIQS
jgi:hypothetical protein